MRTKLQRSSGHTVIKNSASHWGSRTKQTHLSLTPSDNPTEAWTYRWKETESRISYCYLFPVYPNLTHLETGLEDGKHRPLQNSKMQFTSCLPIVPLLPCVHPVTPLLSGFCVLMIVSSSPKILFAGWAGKGGLSEPTPNPNTLSLRDRVFSDKLKGKQLNEPYLIHR